MGRRKQTGGKKKQKGGRKKQTGGNLRYHPLFKRQRGGFQHYLRKFGKPINKMLNRKKKKQSGGLTVPWNTNSAKRRWDRWYIGGMKGPQPSLGGYIISLAIMAQERWNHHLKEEAVCFCRELVQVYKDKNQEQWMKCKIKPDFKALNEAIRRAEKKEEKELIRETFDMGCTFNMKVKDYIAMEKSIYALEFKQHPKCTKHHLFCKVCVVSQGANEGKTFFACDANQPNAPCSSFQWITDDLTKLQNLSKSVDFSKITKPADISTKITNPYFLDAVVACKKAVRTKKQKEEAIKAKREIPVLPPLQEGGGKKRKLYESDDAKDLYDGE
ncbi:hypothetical protein AC249_AIPGENE8677 [Exaiptasia diaphana]|nr:hypothetical protein AC249_AIPGENE8677 [Exaiptasia diaphana]